MVQTGAFEAVVVKIQVFLLQLPLTPDPLLLSLHPIILKVRSQ